MTKYGLFEERIQATIDRARIRYKAGGWEFKERDFSCHTIGDLISVILDVDNEQDAKAFYDSYVDWLNDRFALTEPAEHIARVNIGWCFGEGMQQERIAMWARRCQAAHPFFGTSLPTPEEAFRMGQQAATRRSALEGA